MSLSKKNLLIIAVCYGVLLGVFSFFSARMQADYRRMHCEKIEREVGVAQERVAGENRQLERNAQDLANAAQALLREAPSEWPKNFDALLERNCMSHGREGKGDLPGGNGVFLVPGRRTTEHWLRYAWRDKGKTLRWWSAGGKLMGDEVGEGLNGAFYLDRKWYWEILGQLPQRRVENPEPVWSSPYRDASGPWVVTVGCGIYGKQELEGVAAIDRYQEDIIRDLQAIHPTEGAFALLLNTHPDRDTVMACSREEILKSLFQGDEGLRASTWTDLIRKARRSKLDRSRRQVTLDGRPYLVFHADFKGWMQLVVLVPEEDLAAPLVTSQREAIGLLLLLAIVVLVLAMSLNQKFLMAPLERLMQSVRQLGAGDLETRCAEEGRDELAQLGRMFNAMAHDLKEHIEQVQAETAARERLSGELSVASQIQRDLLPGDFPRRQDLDLVASIRPVREVGGDFYDFCLLDDDHLYFAMCDVAGKGIPAALIMMSARTILRNNAENGLAPSELLARANDALCENNEAGMFVTALVGILEVSTGRLRLANAGHNSPLLIHSDGKSEFVRLESDFVLGGKAGTRYQAQECQLRAGDCLYCCTDGVTEAQDKGGSFFGEERLKMAATKAGLREAGAVLSSVDSALALFTAGAEQADDITQMGILYRGKKSDE